MQIKIFTIPIGDNGSATDEMNRFLRANKILEVQNQLISNENGAYWCFCPSVPLGASISRLRLAVLTGTK